FHGASNIQAQEYVTRGANSNFELWFAVDLNLKRCCPGGNELGSDPAGSHLGEDTHGLIAFDAPIHRKGQSRQASLMARTTAEEGVVRCSACRSRVRRLSGEESSSRD